MQQKKTNDNRGAKHFKYQVKRPNIFWKWKQFYELILLRKIYVKFKENLSINMTVFV